MDNVELNYDRHKVIENGKSEVNSDLFQKNHDKHKDKNGQEDQKYSVDDKPQSTIKNQSAQSKKKKRRNKSKSNSLKLLNRDSIDNTSEGLDTINSTKTTTTTTTQNTKQHPNETSQDIVTSSKHEESYNNTDEVVRPQLSSPVTLSPRKQTIMRYKKSDDKINEGSVINEIKGNLKASKQIINEIGDENKYNISNNIDLDEKVTLFKYKSSKILIFHEQLNDNLSKSTGRLLAHGDFEIFQLHNGKVTYLSCGQSFIYPLLPKLKILRISFNQFILPLSNPERYWKIFINSEESNVIGILENTFEKVVRYRNLFFSNNVDKNDSGKSETINNQPEELNSAVKNTTYNYNNIPYNFALSEDCHTIPESPPSQPISPHQESTNIKSEKFPLSSSDIPFSPGWSLSKESTLHARNSINTNYNGIEDHGNLVNKIENQNVKLNIPISQIQRYVDTNSDSDDSLLEEYEERILTSKSMNFRSYSISRPISRSSSAIIKNYNVPIQYNGNNRSELSDEFPTTSLSEYNRTRNRGVNISRKSSRSELYNSESNWMEPNNMYSKRNHVMSSYKNKNTNLNETYKNIYSSISSRNIHGFIESDSKPKNNRNTLLEFGNGPSRLYKDRNYKTTVGSKNSNHIQHDQHDQLYQGKDNTMLKSREIYNYIKPGQMSTNGSFRNNTNKTNNGGFASKVFGWF